ncbi:hypothetical protein KC345_g260 [Hortaea werneckii]|nr:hypothetical protein KC345_g260 [Hortaea werneckii]
MRSLMGTSEAILPGRPRPDRSPRASFSAKSEPAKDMRCESAVKASLSAAMASSSSTACCENLPYRARLCLVTIPLDGERFTGEPSAPSIASPTKVVFPEPLSPTKPTRSPGWMSLLRMKARARRCAGLGAKAVLPFAAADRIRALRSHHEQLALLPQRRQMHDHGEPKTK